MKRVFLALLLWALSVPALAQVTIDPFTLNESKRSDVTNNDQGYSSTAGRTLRSSAINPAQRTLVLFIDGQSNMASVGPSSFTPVNGAAIDNFNIYNGATYATTDPVLGSSYDSTLGVGSLGPRIADQLITNGKFDRVILVPVAIGGTSISIHAAGGILYDRVCVGMRRLAVRGIVPGATGVTFAYLWGQGESDHGTAQGTYQGYFGQIVARAQNCSGLSAQFNGRIFVNRETLLSGVTDATIQAAQSALVNNTTIFAGGDIDSLTGANRQADNTHLSAAGQAAAATLIYNAMHASGAPF